MANLWKALGEVYGTDPEPAGTALDRDLAAALSEALGSAPGTAGPTPAPPVQDPPAEAPAAQDRAPAPASIAPVPPVLPPAPAVAAAVSPDLLASCRPWQLEDDDILPARRPGRRR